MGSLHMSVTVRWACVFFVPLQPNEWDKIKQMAKIANDILFVHIL